MYRKTLILTKRFCHMILTFNIINGLCLIGDTSTIWGTRCSIELLILILMLHERYYIRRGVYLKISTFSMCWYAQCHRLVSIVLNFLFPRRIFRTEENFLLPNREFSNHLPSILRPPVSQFDTRNVKTMCGRGSYMAL